MRPDDDLRVRFAELRNDDRATAPGFRGMWDAAQDETGVVATRRPALWMAAAAAILVIAAGVAVRWTRVEQADSLPAGESISTWASPTASLLRMSGVTVLDQPSILASVLDGATNPAIRRKGD
jgi:hypothetical protein